MQSRLLALPYVYWNYILEKGLLRYPIPPFYWLHRLLLLFPRQRVLRYPISPIYRLHCLPPRQRIVSWP